MYSTIPAAHSSKPPAPRLDQPARDELEAAYEGLLMAGATLVRLGIDGGPIVPFRRHLAEILRTMPAGAGGRRSRPSRDLARAVHRLGSVESHLRALELRGEAVAVGNVATVVRSALAALREAA